MNRKIFKKLNIIYFGDVTDINGVNLVTNMFLLGSKVFEKNDILLTKIFSSNGIVDCNKESQLPIGNSVGTVKYKFIRAIRSVLKKLLDSRVPCFAWFKVKKNFIDPAKKVIEDNYPVFDGDYIIFQDIFTAYYYYKNEKIKKKRTLLVLHSERDIFGQFKLLYPGVFKSSYKDRLYGIADFALNAVSEIVYVSKKSALVNANEKGNVHFVHNGIPDISSVELSAIKSDQLDFVCVGSINYNKGQDIIIESISLLPPSIRDKCKFYFIGDGPQLSELKVRSINYGLSDYVEFLGLRNDVHELLKRMDVLLLMSKTEGLPLSIIEALRQGLYVVATDVGGISEMINDDFGVLIERSPEKLKAEIEDIFLKNKVNEMSRDLSRKYYESHFTLNLMIDKYSDILKDKI